MPAPGCCAAMPEASAPGKLLICGEYAVLHGAPAVVTAVTARARARVLPAERSRLVVAGRSWPFACSVETGLDWSATAPGAPGALLEAVVAELRARADVWRPQTLRIELDSSELQLRDAAGVPTKAGLGSSAAVLTALAAALLPAWELTLAPGAFVEFVLAAHRRFQGGRGSGVDVLAAIHGGLLRTTPVQGPAASRPLDWPAGLFPVLVWSGRPASTPQRIAAYTDFRQSGTAAGLIGSLEVAARNAADAWERGAKADILATTAAFADALAALDAAGNIGILTPEHRELAALAARYGVVYKTSGAGGGDLGLALTDDAERAARLREAFIQSGYQVPQAGLAGPGLRLLA